MRIITCILFTFLAACGPEAGPEPTQVEYKITPQDSGFQIEISHNGPYLNKQSYFVTPKPKDPKDPSPHFIFQRGYFQMTGSDFIRCMGVDPAHKKSIRIIWNAPNGWNFASSFSEQTFEASCDDLIDALYVGGNDPTLSIQKTWFGTLVVKGPYKHLKLSDIEDALEKNMTRVAQFWEPISKAGPYHLVSIRSFDSPKKDYFGGGSAHFQSFQLDLPADQQKGDGLDHLITHEYFHDWNPKKFNVPRVADSIEHVDILWFTEGFTEYYAHQLVFEKSRNYTFYKERENAPKNMPLFLQKHFYNDPEQKKKLSYIPYVHGRRLADKLDRQIYAYSKKTRRLKTFMDTLLERSKTPSFHLTNENIAKILCEENYLNCDEVKSLINKHIIEGQALDPVINPLI